MELSLKAMILAFCCLALCSFQLCKASKGKLKNQYCGDWGIYCPRNGLCFKRALRCSWARVCLDSNGNKAKCYESDNAGMYNYYPLSSSSSSRKQSLEDFTHWFVEYRGFVPRMVLEERRLFLKTYREAAVAQGAR